MYDLLIDIISTLFKHGLSLSSVGAIVFLFLKQKKMKARLKKFWPWMFSDDVEVKEYIVNQQIIMKNQELIMSAMGVEPCVYGNSKKLFEPDQKNSRKSLNLLQPAESQEPQLRRENMKIVIDAGHGGNDPGAIGTTGTREKDFTLTMALKIQALLKNKVDTVLTRDTDIYLLLSDRVKIAKQEKADVFISIHANSSTTNATGTETFYTMTESVPFANVIHKYLIKATELKDRGVKYGNYHVVRETTMPAALIEVGFINNKSDEEKLFNEAFQDKVAQSIADGVLDYLGIDSTPIKQEPYPVMDVLLHTSVVDKFTGYNIKNQTWIPSRPIGELLGAVIDYKKGKVLINGNEVETLLINGTGYVLARDLTKLTGAKLFWDKKNPNLVDIFKGE